MVEGDLWFMARSVQFQCDRRYHTGKMDDGAKGSFASGSTT